MEKVQQGSDFGILHRKRVDISLYTSVKTASDSIKWMGAYRG